MKTTRAKKLSAAQLSLLAFVRSAGGEMSSEHMVNRGHSIATLNALTGAKEMLRGKPFTAFLEYVKDSKDETGFSVYRITDAGIAALTVSQ